MLEGFAREPIRVGGKVRIVEPEPLYRLLEEAVIEVEDGPKRWRVTWKNIETGDKIARILTQDDYETSLAQSRPADKPRWSRDEIEEIGKSA